MPILDELKKKANGRADSANNIEEAIALMDLSGKGDEYITPEMYGAVGDGVTDDTNALREAFYDSHVRGCVLQFPVGKKYYVTGSVNYRNDEYYSIDLNVQGFNPTKHGEYTLSNYGGIILADNTSLFGSDNSDRKEVSGSIRNLSIVGKNKGLSTSVFSICRLLRLHVYGCNMSQIGAVMRDVSAAHLTVFDSNKFLSAYYFSKFDGNVTNFGLTDSILSNNYINGGEELNDNACFEFGAYNGSVITNNFIDYYQVIYRPKSSVNITSEGCSSIGNNYQVFRHLYWFDLTANHITSAEKYTFIGDVFNWTKESSLPKLGRFSKYTYTDRDGVEREYPPTIFSILRSAESVVMENAVIQSNVDMGDIVFIASSPASYPQGYAKFTSNLNPLYIGTIASKLGTKPIYNWGSYPENHYDIDVIVKVDSIPQFAMDWTVAFPGMKILYNKEVYTATNHWNGSSWQAKWYDKFGNTPQQ